MEQNKYYTPKIEEFHVGFQYEAKVKINKDFGIYTYCSEGDFLELEFGSYNAWIIYKILKDNPEAVRVKYLDKSDIESLGFIKRGEIEQYDLRSKNYIIRKENQKLSIHIIDDKDTIIETLFNGYIKNLSELITLLKQLGVL